MRNSQFIIIPKIRAALISGAVQIITDLIMHYAL